MEKLLVIKIGGNIIDDASKLSSFLRSFASVQGKKILVHGGGKIATKLASQLETLLASLTCPNGHDRRTAIASRQEQRRGRSGGAGKRPAHVYVERRPAQAKSSARNARECSANRHQGGIERRRDHAQTSCRRNSCLVVAPNESKLCCSER